MRLKVGDTRVAVSKRGNVDRLKRGILYNANFSGDLKDRMQCNAVKDYTEEQIVARINNADKLYSAFFHANEIRVLREHFKNIVKHVEKEVLINFDKEEQVKKLKDVLSKYKGYKYYGKNGKFASVNEFKFNPVGKDIEWVISNYVFEYMDKCWYEEKSLRAAVEILICICDGVNYGKNIEEFLKKVDSQELLKAFIAACTACKCEPFIEGMSNLEKVFDALISRILYKCDPEARKKYLNDDKEGIECLINNQIEDIEKLSYLKVPTKEKTDTIYLKGTNAYTCKYVEDERLNAILIRMRKSLKKGTNRDIAIELLKGLASGNFSGAVSNLKLNKGKQLARFINSLNKDYYKFSLVGSIRNMDVKAQVYETTPDNSQDDKTVPSKDEPAKDMPKLYRLSISNSDKNRGLIETLERYADSKQNADNILIEIKKLLYTYFMPDCICDNDTLFKEAKIWKFPKKEGVYFDDSFECERQEDKYRKETQFKITEILSAARINQKLLKKRINYVNVGRCISLKEKYKDSSLNKYWIAYIKDFVEKNYVNGKDALTKEECLASNMIYACWRAIIRFICGKYIDLGKMVYHVAMPNDMSLVAGDKCGIRYGIVQEDYEDGISSFVYENISADDNLKRSIAVSTVVAVNNFTRAAYDEGVEDCLFPKENEGDGLRADAVKQVLRFYGGESTFKQEFTKEEFVGELTELLKVIRNENYHYTPGREGEIELKYSIGLFNHDVEKYKDLVKKRYYTNNVASFYDVNKIVGLVNDLYSHTDVGEAQIPSFYSVWKKNDLPDDIARIFKCNISDDEKTQYYGAVYFLLREIYYRDFIINKASKAFDKFINILNNENVKINRDKKRYSDDSDGVNIFAENHFKRFIDVHKKECNTFGSLCQKIMNQYGIQNSNRIEEKYKHFKMLLIKYTKLAFIEFIKEKYEWVMKYDRAKKSALKGEDNYLDNERIKIMVPVVNSQDYGVYMMAWYTFGHYIHPKQLNLLIGEFKNYIQYKNDIRKRAQSAGQIFSKREQERNNSRIDKAWMVIEILDFVRSVESGVSGIASDYYGNSEQNNAWNDYARYLSNYIDFAGDEEPTFDNLLKFCNSDREHPFDIYVDDKPKILHNVEFARMYAGGDVPLISGINEDDTYKITGEEIRDCLKRGKSVAVLLDKGRCSEFSERQAVVEYQQLKERITLNDVTGIYEIVSELLGKLISLSYLRERDHMYMLLGFYYTLLQGKKDWTQIIIDKRTGKEYEENKCNFDAGCVFRNSEEVRIVSGLVLYQIIGVFDYGTKFLYWEKSTEGHYELKNMGYCQLSAKLSRFYLNHGASYDCVMRLFYNGAYEKDIIDIRNYVDHTKYYANHDKSIMELYSDYYTKCFGYSTRLRQSVVNNLQNVLEKHFVESRIKFKTTKDVNSDKSKVEIVFANDLSSKKNDYKLSDGKKVQTNAKSEKFLKMLKAVLEYKKS